MICASPLLHAGATPGGKTYEDWAAHAASRVPTVQGPASNIPYNGVAGSRLFRATYSAAAVSPSAVGSPWSYRYAGNFEVLLIHSMISAAAAEEQKANNGTVIFNVNGLYEVDYLAGITRNGITTSTYDLPGNPGTFYWITEASFWDFTLGKPRTINPYTASGPVDYTNPGWTP